MRHQVGLPLFNYKLVYIVLNGQVLPTNSIKAPGTA